MKLSIKLHSQNISRQKMASRRYTRSKFGDVFIFVMLAAAGLFTMLPLIYAVCTSFKPLDELLIFPPRFFVRRPTLGNYLILPDLMASLRIPLSRYIFNSLMVTIVATFFYIIISAMAAFVLSKATFKGRNVLFWTIQFALMFNTYTLAVPQYLIFSKMQIIDTYWVYILPHMASTLGVFLMKQYIEGYIPDALLEAARIDGAGDMRILFTIILPLSKSILATVALWTAVANWNSWFPCLLYIRDTDKYVLQVILRRIILDGSSEFVNMEVSNMSEPTTEAIKAATTIVTILPIILVYPFLQKYFVQGVMVGSLKG